MNNGWSPHAESPAVFAKLSGPFAAATGKGIKVAVIDSGVNVHHPHIVAPTTGQAIEPNGHHPERLSPQPNICWSDELGHGTAVMAAIQEKAPEADYFALKLFSDSLTSTSATLIRALRLAILARAHLINLSLGTPNLDYRNEFESLIHLAHEAGCILVCARQEGERPVLPGMLPGVVSVDVDWRLPRNGYRIDESGSDFSCFASGFPRPLPGISPIRNLSGVSFAVANMTGLLARACEVLQKPSLQQLKEGLASEALLHE